MDPQKETVMTKDELLSTSKSAGTLLWLKAQKSSLERAKNHHDILDTMNALSMEAESGEAIAKILFAEIEKRIIDETAKLESAGIDLSTF